MGLAISTRYVHSSRREREQEIKCCCYLHAASIMSEPRSTEYQISTNYIIFSSLNTLFEVEYFSSWQPANKNTTLFGRRKNIQVDITSYNLRLSIDLLQFKLFFTITKDFFSIPFLLIH